MIDLQDDDTPTRPAGLWIDVERGVAGIGLAELHLSAQEVAVLGALSRASGSVLSRRELARRAGLHEASSRRADRLLVALRREVGPHAVRNIRGRGWALDHDAIAPRPRPTA